MRFPMLRPSLIAGVIGLAILCVPARAQAPARSNSNLQRLAEIMGALHYLRASAVPMKARSGATRCRP